MKTVGCHDGYFTAKVCLLVLQESSVGTLISSSCLVWGLKHFKVLCNWYSTPVSLSQTMVSEHFSRFPATANQTVNTTF